MHFTYSKLKFVRRCSNLFKQNKDDFVFINRYAIESLLEIIAVRNSLPNFLMVS